MEKAKEPGRKSDYKVIISELETNPFQMIKIAFALMGIIPLLVLFYIIIGKNFMYRLFLGSNGFIIGISVIISLTGFFVAYTLVIKMVLTLLSYSSERKLADEAKTELLLSVSHDLKTPLAVIRIGMQNMLDGIAGSISKTQTEIAQACLRAINKSTNFINGLLDPSKVNFARINYKRELMDFEEIIKDEVRAIIELARRDKQQVKCRILTKETTLWGDRDKLSRVVMNLLSNAVKYTPVNGKIDLELSSDEDTLKLSVINTGPGILPEGLDKIFNKHERLKPNSKIEGTGLGLCIAKDIVDVHSGHLTVKSQPDVETEFSVVLPRDLRKGRLPR